MIGVAADFNFNLTTTASSQAHGSKLQHSSYATAAVSTAFTCACRFAAVLSTSALANFEPIITAVKTTASRMVFFLSIIFAVLSIK
jgi:hypothetical protein